MTDGVRHRALGRLGGVLAVNVDAHAHLGDTAHACHGFSNLLLMRAMLVRNAAACYAGIGAGAACGLANGLKVVAIRNAQRPSAQEPI